MQSKSTISKLTGSLLKLVAVSALMLGAAGISQQAVAGIANTKHNLGSTGAAGNNKTSDTGEICVFCHTPHAADTTAPAPLWNKNLSSIATGFTTYSTASSSTIDGEVLAVGSVSIACLSCHDGSQAMDNIINAPGSGGYDTTGGGANGRAYTWSGSSVNAQGVMQSSSIAMLGKDLTNDHPIGIQYCGGGQTAATPTGACKDTDFKGPGSGLNSATINSQLVWWVDSTGAGGTAGSRDKTDMILYSRAFAAGTGPSVECASCHDPHTETNPTFLRVSNVGSGVCLSCHVK
ncbi:MAG: cytochrome c3 family protein [Candidatus Accumulibacter sp.]|uniref:cytochrome c3 family protein n=1 Tax=Accumulibacter sp. TaxID=2053492 RepID=UPI0028791809|nr:cytochrome c3 family protein [Accumulibacter sp.]MDS4015270.1 cytochrome c3 family protein [Accumulibacter sp.]